VRLDDWRNLPAEALAPIFDAERARWGASLQWDLGPSVTILERARSQGTLPGLVVRGPGQSIVGWTYFLVQQGVLQVGALHARTADGVRLLLDAIFKTPEATLAQEVLLFVYPDSPACESALQRRRFAITRYWYMQRTLDRSCLRELDGALRPLQEADGPDVVRLLARAYQGQAGARCFAPHGRLEEWAQYFGQLTRGTAIGEFLPEASLVATGERIGLQAAAVVTSLAPQTLHLAQLAVEPSARRRGLGGRLLDGMMGYGLAQNRSIATLLVSEHNAAARALYDARGFVPTGYFLHAERPLGRRIMTPPVAVSA
jgi:ribosomal protein S18 acetylase RimI-like enzyme